MEEARSQKTDLVWAAVYLSVVTTAALAMLFTFAGGAPLDRAIAVDLIAGWLGSATAVVLLLALPGGKVLLVLGRVLVLLVFFTLVIAAVLGCISVIAG